MGCLFDSDLFDMELHLGCLPTLDAIIFLQYNYFTLPLRVQAKGVINTFLFNKEEALGLYAIILMDHNEVRYKTHDSESRGQEEAAGLMQRMSELFTRSNSLKFVSALNKPPLKLLFSYQGLS